MNVSMELKDVVRPNPKATILAKCSINTYIEQYNTIYAARQSNLFDAIINPTKLPDFKKLNRFDRNKCVSFSKFSTFFSNLIKKKKSKLIYFFYVSKIEFNICANRAISFCRHRSISSNTMWVNTLPSRKCIITLLMHYIVKAHLPWQLTEGLAAEKAVY